MVYALANLDRDDREEIPLMCKTDRGARIKAKQYAKKHKIKAYGIIFYRAEDGCRGWIDK